MSVTRSTRSKAARAAQLAAVAVVGAALLRRRYLGWGATDEDKSRSLAGDELLPSADQTATRAITVDTGAENVWPWIVQLGQGRGGFYSYDWLENSIAHIDIHNANEIVPEWQGIGVGSQVRLAPDLALQVAVVDQGRALVLRGGVPLGRTASPYDFTWAFVLLPQADRTTRLVVRERYQYSWRWAGLIVQPAQLVSSFMSPEMLRGIKTRAERTGLVPNGSVGDPPLTANSSDGPRSRFATTARLNGLPGLGDATPTSLEGTSR